MGAPDRHVRHLRLNAGDAAEVRAMLPRLEDGLRCASLPDGGSRVLLVRRLALGLIPRDVSPQGLSLLIERRVATLGGVWTEGGTAAAVNANCIVFPSRLEARVRLALRLLRGEPADEWYWRPAVPEFRPDLSVADKLLAMARALARLPEARVALPAWAARLVEAGHTRQLIAAIRPDVGEELLGHAGIGMGPARRFDAPAAIVAPGPGGRPVFTLRQAAGSQAVPAWLRVLLNLGSRDRHVAEYAATRLPATRAQNADQTVFADRPSADSPDIKPGIKADVKTAINPEGKTDCTCRPVSGHGAAGPASVIASQVRGSDTASDPAYGRIEIDTRELTGHDATNSLAGEEPAVTPDASPWLAATRAGGLLFLLPVLARLGIAECTERLDLGLGLGADGEGLARRVLAAALHRLGVDASDPAWSIVHEFQPDVPCKPEAVPAAWTDPLLAPPHARRLAGMLLEALAHADSLNLQARAWLDAARRWLRRGGHIGLASLVLRPARLSATPTHVDVHFRLQDTDLRVRRLGLDLDPGWLPWFGQVVAFHFDLGETS